MQSLDDTNHVTATQKIVTAVMAEFGHHEPYNRLASAWLEVVEAAVERGIAVERQRCASVVEGIFGDQDGGLADLVRSGE